MPRETPAAVDFLSDFDNPDSHPDVVARIVVAQASSEAASPLAKRPRRTRAAAARDGSGLDTGRVDQQQPDCRVVKEIHAHRILLARGSDVFKAQLGPDWAASQPVGVLDVLLEDESEAEAAVLVLKAMYCPADVSAPLREESQATLLKVLSVANRFCAERAETAAISTLSGRLLDWDTAMAVFALPASLREGSAYAPLLTAAGGTLQRSLGDLDAVWLDGEKQEQLLRLPFVALKQLLQDKGTRAASENTVVFTVWAWAEEEDSRYSEEEMAQLVACVRLPHVTKMYCAAVASPVLTRLSPSITADDVHNAAVFGEAEQWIQNYLKTEEGSPVSRFPAWQLPRRPRSAVTSATLSCDVPLETFKELEKRALQLEAGWGCVDYMDAEVEFNGARWELSLSASRLDSGLRMSVGLNIVAPDVPSGRLVSADASVTVAGRVVQKQTTALFRVGCGNTSDQPLGYILGDKDRLWDEAKARELAGADGKIPISIKVESCE